MPSSTIALPAPDRGWILYSGGSEIARGPDLGELVGKRAGVVVGLPAASVTTFLVELPKVEPSLHESMVRAQVEKRGFPSKGDALVDFESVASREATDTFLVRVVPELPADLVTTVAAGYHTAADLHAEAASVAALATVRKEHGRLVLAVESGGRALHVQVLSGKPEVGASLARELKLILLGLRAESVFEGDPPTGVVLALDEVSESDLAEFRSGLSVPVSLARPAAPVRAEGRDRLLPRAVKESRRRRRTAVRTTALVVVGLFVYAVVGMWVWKDAQATKRTIEALERGIAILEPDVERIQQVEQRWRSLEPSFNKDFFPIVQLSRITGALPGSGVVIREYRTTGRNIRIRGQARDVQLANRLLEDLRGMEGFAAYEWSMPNPRVERNNTATFEIQGKPKNEGADS